MAVISVFYYYLIYVTKITVQIKCPRKPAFEAVVFCEKEKTPADAEAFSSYLSGFERASFDLGLPAQ